MLKRKLITLSIATALSSPLVAHAQYVYLDGGQYSGLVGAINATTSAVGTFAGANTASHVKTTAAITAALSGQTATIRATQEKVATTINNNAELEAQRKEDQRVIEIREQIERRHKLPPSPCTTGAVGDVNANTQNSAKGGGMGKPKGKSSGNGGDGGGVSNEVPFEDGAKNKIKAKEIVEDILTTGTKTESRGAEVETARKSTLHYSDFCTDEERTMASTKDLCVKNSDGPSKAPNGHVSFKAFLDGPGFARHVENAKGTPPAPHKTLTEYEKAVAALFMKGLSGSENFTKKLSPKQMATPKGIQYFALLKDYERQESIGLAPFAQSIERRSPSVAVKPLIDSMKRAEAAGEAAFEGEDATQYGSSAYAYFERWKKDRDAYLALEGATNESDRMSAEDLLAFDVNRRYLNPDWYVEIAGMEAESPIVKEQAFMTAQTNYLLQSLIEKVELNNKLLGAQQVNSARDQYGPALLGMYEEIVGSSLSSGTK
jgi:hypothetical protein